MHVETVPSVIALDAGALATKTAVVIDVLRATSVMTTALAHGATSIYPVLTTDQAHELGAHWPRDHYLLAGERQALPIPGFDMGNSPLEATVERVKDKKIVMTTTNGTRTIQAASSAKNLLIGCLLNAAVVADRVLDYGDDLVLVCSGTREAFDLSDAVCAGAIASLLVQKTHVHLDDLSLTMTRVFEAYHEDLFSLVAASVHGQRLLSLGLGDDLAYCLQVGTQSVVPVYRQGCITTE